MALLLASVLVLTALSEDERESDERDKSVDVIEP
jgi:hypothetical protein